MKHSDVLHLKIEIKTKSDTNFLELAILLDKPEFLTYLPKIRHKYGFEKLRPLSEYYGRLINKFSTGEQVKFDFSTYENAQKLIDYANTNAICSDGIEDEELHLSQRLDIEANILCYLFHRPPHFASSIVEAIVCGAVEGDLFKSTSAEILENNTILSTTAPFQLPQAAIVVTPTSTDLDIIRELGIIRNLYKTDSKLSYYKPRTDKVNRIRAYREWYWLRLAGKKYSKISDDWIDTHPNDSVLDENVIYKGVAQYKKLLSQ